MIDKRSRIFYTTFIASAEYSRIDYRTLVASGGKTLAGGPADILEGNWQSIVFVGDVYASPLSPEPFTSTRFADRWIRGNGSGDGFNCCQADDLLNTTSTLDERSDIVLLKEEFKTNSIQVVGDNPLNCTPSNLWPTAHAGVVEVLSLISK